MVTKKRGTKSVKHTHVSASLVIAAETAKIERARSASISFTDAIKKGARANGPTHNALFKFKFKFKLKI
jgi:hypothetical protein